MANITADRELFDRMRAREGPDAERVEFPSFYPERRIPLDGNDFLIGKHSASQGLLPEIDLGTAPVDIGVSRSHARLHIDGDTVTVTDLGSTNGTSLNGSDDVIEPETAIPLRSGDRIHVGGWTTITVTRESA
ncbi:pSer/pThr/pTyr-binding forkhead associated (FHA) protein [Nocardia transvalensis]|uniref:PSer/pThr/pTyr-binding forkhead associated (FHA) protein n=1 Tax=Nocardia transvalensis TaxID=37333 RepID=A0A7W9PBK6_9NOCA|nr:FHA domain-containing protein [Nocardia transvalensis]MBB5913025.1 pSer/pThr/pTyr-binding forkhead associated (FHA) protein [Nocardia transvalensis]